MDNFLLWKDRWIELKLNWLELPPLSMDITPLDMSFWSMMKRLITQRKPSTFDELKIFTIETLNQIEPQVIIRICQEVDKRYRSFIKFNIVFEHILSNWFFLLFFFIERKLYYGTGWRPFIKPNILIQVTINDEHDLLIKDLINIMNLLQTDKKWNTPQIFNFILISNNRTTPLKLKDNKKENFVFLI